MRARNADSRARKRSLLRVTAVIAVLSGSMVGWTADTAAQDVAAGQLAAAIRANHHPCQHVIEQQTVSQSPTILRVRCNSGVFKVKISDGSVSDVEPVD